jgi:predicted metal-dependent TIM-barrel fold hydrolase
MMECGVNRIIDSHVHLRLLYKFNPERIEWLSSRGCSVISWAFGGKIDSVSDLKRYLETRRSVFASLRNQGLSCHHLCGIHPRKIPPDLQPEAVAGLLAPFLEDAWCVGMGEIGLETGSARELEILSAQLEFGLSLGRDNIRFGIHTPRQRKEAVTRQLFEALAPFETALAPVTVIDHCTDEIIGEVLSRGYHAGISLSSNKSSENDLVRMMARFGPQSDRIMCNTDSSRQFFEDLVLAARNAKLDPRVAENLFFSTAARFFNIPGTEIAS